MRMLSFACRNHIVPLFSLTVVSRLFQYLKAKAHLVFNLLFRRRSWNKDSTSMIKGTCTQVQNFTRKSNIPLLQENKSNIPCKFMYYPQNVSETKHLYQVVFYGIHGSGGLLWWGGVSLGWKVCEHLFSCVTNRLSYPPSLSHLFMFINTMYIIIVWS